MCLLPTISVDENTVADVERCEVGEVTGEKTNSFTGHCVPASADIQLLHSLATHCSGKCSEFCNLKKSEQQGLSLFVELCSAVLLNRQDENDFTKKLLSPRN